MKPFTFGLLAATIIDAATFAWVLSGQFWAFLFVGLLAILLTGAVVGFIVVFGYLFGRFFEGDNDRERPLHDQRLSLGVAARLLGALRAVLRGRWEDPVALSGRTELRE